MFEADTTTLVTYRDIIIFFGECVREVKEALHKEGRGNKFLGARVSVANTLNFVNADGPSRSSALQSKLWHRKISIPVWTSVFP